MLLRFVSVGHNQLLAYGSMPAFVSTLQISTLPFSIFTAYFLDKFRGVIRREWPVKRL